MRLFWWQMLLPRVFHRIRHGYHRPGGLKMKYRFVAVQINVRVTLWTEIFYTETQSAVYSSYLFGGKIFYRGFTIKNIINKNRDFAVMGYISTGAAT